MPIGLRLRWVHCWVDKRSGGAKARYYFRRPGFQRVPLPGLPGSAEFMAAYQAALDGQALPRPMIGASRTKAGSIGALVTAYYGSPQFLTLKPSSQRIYRLILERFRTAHGDKPVGLLMRQHLTGLLAERATTPAAANNWLRLMKVLLAYAVEEGWRPDNPATGIRRIRRQSTGFHSWSEAEIAAFESRHAIGTKARLAFALLLYTAQRRSDVVRIGRQHVRAGAILVRQQKTGTTLAIPVHPALQAVLDATPSEHLTFLTNVHGKPFTAASFGFWFRQRCNEADLPHCAAHGLRKAACRRLAEAGCSANVIAAISGHSTLTEVSRYTKAADQERLARDGMAAIARTGVGNAAKPVAKSRKKA
jgi:integrase